MNTPTSKICKAKDCRKTIYPQKTEALAFWRGYCNRCDTLIHQTEPSEKTLATQSQTIAIGRVNQEWLKKHS